MIANFLSTDIRVAMPILIAAMGLVFSERAGVVNIGAEGVMLIGALSGFAGTSFTGSIWLGLLIAALISGLAGAWFAFLTVTVRANQTVVGAAFNILGLGLTTTMCRIIFGVNQIMPKIPSLKRLAIPVLSEIPLIGDVLFNRNLLDYLIYFLIAASHIVMFHTELGLKIRAVGENPGTCDTVGINVFRLRGGCIIYSMMLCGLGGAYLSTVELGVFTEDMISGRGFMALAAVVFGRWKPLGVLAAALVFGLGEAIQYKMQALQSGVSFHLMLTLPYVLTLMALIGMVGRSHAPAASGQPYMKGE